LVSFVGAGPGDPELLTLKAQRLIAEADVIIYAGSLVNPAVLAHARPGAAIHDSASMKLAEQIEVMNSAVARGLRVVRLHTGDPAIYGAILEQMRELDRLGIPYCVVPGVSSAFAAAAALRIEYTVPGDTQTVIFTRVGGRTDVPEREALRNLAAHRTSLVLFLSAGMIDRVVDDLVAAGYGPDTPVAMVARASWPDELVVQGTLADIVERAQAAEITHQALIIVSPALSPQARGAGSHASALYGIALDPPARQPTVAIVALTKGGSETASRLHAEMAGATLYLPERFSHSARPDQGAAANTDQGGWPASDGKAVIAYTSSVRQVLQHAFAQHAGVVAIMSSGIVVRDLAPLLRSKHADPAVVVVDERGSHAISLLAGHQGGGNALARRVAGLLGGTAVITTASDVQKLPALDLLGRAPGPGRPTGVGNQVVSGGESTAFSLPLPSSRLDRGWRLVGAEALTRASAALVNGDPVGVVQEAGDEAWWPAALPAYLARYLSLEALAAAGVAAALVITHRDIPREALNSLPCAVVYHPPCLVLGIGCNRGTPAAEILAAVDATLADAGLSVDSAYLVATVVDKASEPGLLLACQERGWRLHAYARAELAAIGQPPNPSPWALRVLGVPGVAEPSATLAAGTSELLVQKRRFPNVTVAVARAPADNWDPRGGASVEVQAGS
jgi:precorrin-4 C11-methyltransferase